MKLVNSIMLSKIAYEDTIKYAGCGDEFIEKLATAFMKLKLRKQ